jgi:hypothetical protein
MENLENSIWQQAVAKLKHEHTSLISSKIQGYRRSLSLKKLSKIFNTDAA